MITKIRTNGSNIENTLPSPPNGEPCAKAGVMNSELPFSLAFGAQAQRPPARTARAKSARTIAGAGLIATPGQRAGTAPTGLTRDASGINQRASTTDAGHARARLHNHGR